MVQIATAQAKDVQGEAPLIGFEGALSAQKVAMSIGDAAQKIAQPIIKSQQNAEYSSTLSKATVDMSNQVQQRYLEQTGKDGTPTYKNLVGDVQNIITATRNKYSAQLSDPEVAERFNDSFNNLGTQQLVEAGHTARTQQINWIKSSLKNTLAQQSQQFGTAGSPQMKKNAVNQINIAVDGAVQHGALTQPEGEQLKKDAIQSGTVQHFLFQIDSNHPQDVLNALKDGGTKYGLDQDKVYTLQSRAYAAIARQRAYLNASYKSLKKDLSNQSSAIQEMQKTGIPVPQHLIDQFNATAKGTPYENAVAQNSQDMERTNAFIFKAPDDQQEAINTISKDPQTAATLKQIMLYKSIAAKVKSALSTDGYSFAMQQGVVPKYDPLNFSSSSTFEQGLIQRAPTTKIASEHYGRDLSPMTSDELNNYKTLLSTASPADASQYLRSTVKALGSSSLNVFKEMNKKGAPLLSFVGEKMASGYTAEADKILQGRQLVNANPKLFSEFDRYLPAASDMPNYVVPEYQQAVLSAAKAVYAVNMRDGGFMGWFSRQTSPSKGVMHAIKEVVGSTISYKGQNIEPPDPSVSESDFHSFMKSLTIEDVKELGGIAGIKTQEQLDQLKDHMILRSEGGGNYAIQYQIASSDVPAIAKLEGKKAHFVLDYKKVLSNRMIDKQAFKKPLSAITPKTSLSQLVGQDQNNE